MPDSFADSISLPRKRLVMAGLLVIMLVMAITAGGSLWLVVNEARQLGRPGSHGELWQVYQIRNGSGVGVFAPQFGPRRGFFFGLTKDF